MEQTKKVSPAVKALIVVVLLGVVVASVVILNNKPSSDTTPTTQDASTTTPAATTPTDTTGNTNTAGTYKDGTYTAVGNYSTPDGREALSVTLTIADNTITSSSVSQDAQSREGAQYQSQFSANYKSLVVGKKVDEVSLSRVAGSSLTSNGFNTALETIKADAAV